MSLADHWRLQSDLRRWGLPANLPSVAAGLDELTLEGPIDRIDWLPEGPSVVHVRDCRVQLPRLPDGVRTASLFNCDLQTLDKLPEGLESLDVTHNPALAEVTVPEGLRSLTVGGDGFRRLGPTPDSLEELRVVGTGAEIDLPGLPQELRILILERIRNRALLGLPPDLERLELKETHVEAIRPWPRALRSLSLEKNSRLHVRELPELLTEYGFWARDPALAIDCQDLPRSISVLRGSRPCRGDLPTGLQLRVIEDSDRLPTTLQSPAPLRRVALHAPLGPETVRRLAESWTSGPSLESLSLVGVAAESIVDLPGEPTHLSLTGCRLRRIGHLPPTLARLELHLCEVDDPTFESHGLEELVYPYVRWEQVPAALASLRKLDVHRATRVTGISKALSNLREVNVAGTSIPRWPPELELVHTLDISSTPITDGESLPKGLRSLTIHRGQLASLPELPELKVLRIVAPLPSLEEGGGGTAMPDPGGTEHSAPRAAEGPEP